MNRNKNKFGRKGLVKLSILCSSIALLFISLTSFDLAKPSESQAYIDHAYFSKLIFNEVNAVRVANGKSRLKWDKICHLAAKEQAAYCAAKGKLTHVQDDPQKKNVKMRYRSFEGKAGTVGENLLTLDFRIPNYKEGDERTERIERRYKSAAKFMVKLWMQSPPHKKNLLYDDYKYAGIGMVYTKKLQVYVGQVFSD